MMRSIGGAVLLCLAAIAAAERSNPFANPAADLDSPNAGGNAAAAGFELRAVMPSPTLALANINGEILAQGDEYRGYVLAEITDSGVSLQRGSSVLELSMRRAEEASDDEE